MTQDFADGGAVEWLYAAAEGSGEKFFRQGAGEDFRAREHSGLQALDAGEDAAIRQTIGGIHGLPASSARQRPMAS